MLMNNPVVMEFGSPLPGTHPLWYDPSYWWQGAKAEFVTAAQLAAVKANLHILFDWALQMGPLIVGALALLVIRLQKERQPGVQHILTWYWLWPLAACTLYLPVHVEPRFLGAFLAILWVGVYGYLLPNSPVGLRAAALVAVIAVLLLPFAATTTRAALASLRHPATPPDQIAATALRSLGLNPGDLLATVGVDFQPFYARSAHLRTVAYVEVPEGPWSLPAAQFDRVKECLASAGIQALVARGRPSLPNPQEWTEIDLPEAGKLQVVMLPASAHRP
jgi:hypothetical protein